MSDIAALVAFELVRRAPSQRTAGLICEMTGYRETALGRFYQRRGRAAAAAADHQPRHASLIALGREPNARHS